MDDLYQATFEWPHSESHSVIVTGSFDQWSSSVHLSKCESGFKGVAKVPWNAKITYKFVVDGNWVINEREPTETDSAGNVNNVYTSPEKPAPPPPEALAETGAVDPAKDITTESTADLAATITATEGTSTSLEYIASAVGAAIQSVVGIDPINSEKIPVDSPKDDVQTPIPDHLVGEPNSSEPTASERQVAPIIPIQVVPVNASENVTTATVPSVAPEASTTETTSTPAVVDIPSSAPAAEIVPEPSTHTPPVVVSSSPPAANSLPASEPVTPQQETSEPASDTKELASSSPSAAGPAAETSPALVKEEPTAPAKASASTTAPQSDTAESKVSGTSVSENKSTPATPAEPPNATPVPSAPSTPAKKDSHRFPSDSPGSVDSSPSSSRYGTISSTHSKRKSIFGRIRTVSLRDVFGKDKGKGKSEK